VYWKIPIGGISRLMLFGGKNEKGTENKDKIIKEPGQKKKDKEIIDVKRVK
jgi:hypothetical protein